MDLLIVVLRYVWGSLFFPGTALLRYLYRGVVAATPLFSAIVIMQLNLLS